MATSTTQPSATESKEKPVVSVGIVASVALILIGIFMLVMSALKMLIGTDSSGSQFTRTNGTVSKIRSRTIDNDMVCIADYNFTVGGQSYSNPDLENSGSSIGYNSENCNRFQGESVTVEYNPSNPADNRLAKSESATNVVADVAMLPIGLVLIAIGIYSMKVVKKAERKQQLDISSLTEAKLLSDTRNDVRYK